MATTAEPQVGGSLSMGVESRGHRPQVRWSWADHDCVAGLTVVIALACTAAAAMAIFGLPPVDLHGPWHYLGVMDPLCGMTRAVRLLALGQVRRAVEYNPASPLLGALGAVVLVRAGIGWAKGRWLRVKVHPSPLTLTALALLVGLLWAHQQTHAALLMHT
jgi:Protein of unknown function (DUF2752)